MIIERTINLMPGPSTVLYRSFIKHCTSTYKAMGTIWRDLFKPPQMRQGHDPRPLWLLVETPPVVGPELASRRAEHSLLWRMPLYIFDILSYHLTCLCSNFYGLSALFGCWSSVSIRSIIYKNKKRVLNVCPYYTAFAVSWKVEIP